MSAANSEDRSPMESRYVAHEGRALFRCPRLACGMAPVSPRITHAAGAPVRVPVAAAARSRPFSASGPCVPGVYWVHDVDNWRAGCPLHPGRPAVRTSLPGDRCPGRTIRRSVLHCRVHHRHLLPPLMPRTHSEAGERVVLSDVGRRPCRGLPGLQALPAGGRPGHTGVEPASRHHRPGHASHRRRWAPWPASWATHPGTCADY